jgi:hypothetical protein
MKEGSVISAQATHRRDFLGRMIGAAASASLSLSGARAAATDSALERDGASDS